MEDLEPLKPIVDYLITGYWKFDGDPPHKWGKELVTIDATELTSTYRTWLQEGAAQISSVADIDFQFVSSDADIEFHLSNDGNSSSSSYQNGIMTSADVWLESSADRQTVLHEFAHALGLGHAGPYNKDQDKDIDVVPGGDQDLTVMSYNGVEDGAEEEPLEFQEADLAAFVQLYGAVEVTPPPPSPPPTTVKTINGTEGDNRFTSGSVDEFIFAKGGNDYISGGNGNDSLYGGAGVDTIYGSWGNDKLYGDTGNDLLYAGQGNDRLEGGAGADRLTGGLGADTFLVDSTDTILDFNASQGDVILNIV